MNRWFRSFCIPSLPLGEDGRRVTGSEKHIEVSRTAACEGMVLLKNNGLLPLKKGTKIAVFGKTQIDFIPLGGGSGYVKTNYIRNLYDGLKVKEQEGKVQVFDALSEFYRKEVERQVPEMIEIGLGRSTVEPEIPNELLEEAKKFTDTAIIAIGRFSTEGEDRNSGKGDFCLNDKEIQMVEKVTENFSNVAVVLNIGGIMDTAWFADNDKISSALLAWYPGMEGGLAAADILCGDVNPSGKLTDTFASCYGDYPSADTFHESDMYVKYYEDIYVGYRYFETIPGAGDKVIYPFGHGLSYTEFSISDISASDDGKDITVTAKVTNIGARAGKEVVQVYVGAPQGKLGKPAKELKAFNKTRLLAPGETEAVTMTFSIQSMASYDDLGKCAKSAYILEQGDYIIYVGSSVGNVEKTDYVYTVKEEYVVCEQLTELCEPSSLEKRLLSDGSFESLKLKPKKQYKYAGKAVNEAKAPSEKAMLTDVADGKVTMDEFLAQLSDEQLCRLLGGVPCTGMANTCGVGGLDEFGIPAIMTADGPAGLRLWVWDRRDCYIDTTSWPCATLLACSWNPEIVYEVGKCGAMEVKENNIGIWLTPAMNIHRNPLCGRNFEYFAEDPLVAGKMAAAKTSGIQSQGVSATLKHFACNNKETKRFDSNSVLSERALREIYIKGFEICVKEANPWLIMTCYNLVNDYQGSENYDLITGILRGEWDYKGTVTTDWATHGLHGYEAKAGNDLKMPRGYAGGLQEFLSTQKMSRSELESCAANVLKLIININC